MNVGNRVVDGKLDLIADLMDLLVLEHELITRANNSSDPAVAEAVGTIIVSLQFRITEDLSNLGFNDAEATKRLLVLQVRQALKAKDDAWQILRAEAARLASADTAYDGN